MGVRPDGLVSQLEKLLPLLDVSAPKAAAPPARGSRIEQSLASALPPCRRALRPDLTDFAVDLAHGCALSCSARPSS